MRQTELLNMQDVLSFAAYDAWVGNNSADDGSDPIKAYILETCDDNGYVPISSDMIELEGEVLFLIEQYSTLLYNFYTHVGFENVGQANVAHIMATMHEDNNNDLAMI